MPEIIKESYLNSWKHFSKHYVKLIICSILCYTPFQMAILAEIPFLKEAISALSSGQPNFPLIGVIFLYIFIATPLLSVLYMSTCYNATQVNNPDSLTFNSPHPFLKTVLVMLAYTILSSIGIGVGCLMLILPGIYLFITWYFASFLILRDGLSPIDAIKASSKRTKGRFWGIFLFAIIAMILNFVANKTYLGHLLIAPLVTMASFELLAKIETQITE